MTIPESESLAGMIRRRRTALTADELAEILSFSQKHIYKLAKQGRIPCIRIGCAIRFDHHTVEAWIEERTVSRVR